MTLLLIRHGESAGNVARIVQGWRDEPLTERGRAQAQAVAARVAAHEPRVAAVYSSTLARARDTAATLAAALELPIAERAELREYGYGEVEGLRWEQVEERFGLTLGQWGGGTVPGEEGPAAFEERVGRCIDELLDRHEHEVAAVVTHGGVITRVVARVLGLPSSAPPRIYLGNGSLTVVAKERGELALVLLNDDCHVPAPDETGAG
jgi:broad specificity phosphatase PhoE